MKKTLFVLAVLLVAVGTNAATIHFNRVTTYTDDTSIPAAKIPTIQYKGYTGPTSSGPWTGGATVTDNQAITASDPAVGGTLWYTVDASLDGMTSNKAVAASKTVPFPSPAVPFGVTVD